MTLEQAKECAKNYLNNEDYKSVFVTSDHAVYINSELSVIYAHCKENKLELFILKLENSTEATEENSTEAIIEKPKKKKS